MISFSSFLLSFVSWLIHPPMLSMKQKAFSGLIEHLPFGRISFRLHFTSAVLANTMSAHMRPGKFIAFDLLNFVCFCALTGILSTYFMKNRSIIPCPVLMIPDAFFPSYPPPINTDTKSMTPCCTKSPSNSKKSESPP